MCVHPSGGVGACVSKKWGDSDCPAAPPLLTPQAVPCCTSCSAWPSLPLCRSVIVENSASSTNATEILKPVKKRKRKDYQSPSEEEYESEQMVGQKQGRGVCSLCPGGQPCVHRFHHAAQGYVSCKSKGKQVGQDAKKA